MICLTFTAAFLLPFMLAVCITDALRARARVVRETEANFGHDTLIFPDYLKP